MKVKIKTLLAGPGGIIQPGQIADVDPEQAVALIAGGFAVAVEGMPEPEKPQVVEDEAAPKPVGTRRSRK